MAIVMKPFANKTLRRKGYVLISDILLPIYTKGMMELRNAVKEIKRSEKFPIKETIANKDDIQILNTLGFDTKKLPVMVKKVDETSKEYKELESHIDKTYTFIEIAVNVDMDYPVQIAEDETQSLWEHLGLQHNKDYAGMVEWLMGLDMVEQEYKIILKTIEIIKASNNKEYEDWSDEILKKYEKYLVEDNAE